jgi:tol-pal system protein YbgF
MKYFWLIGLVLITLQSQAGLFDDDVARQQITDLQKESNLRLQQLEAANRKMLDVVNQMQQMQSDIAKLTGKVDELSYELGMAQKRQQDLYVDLDARLLPFENSKIQAQIQSETKILDVVTANIRAGKYPQAMFSLKKFMTTYPQSKQLGAAYYWLGMSYVGMKDFSNAKINLQKVVTDFSETAHAPDALLAIASIAANQGDTAVSTQTLRTLIQRYGNSAAAQQAKAALASK